MDQLTLLTPVLVLVIWTFIIFLIMAFGRVSFMNNPQDAADSKDYKNQLPTCTFKSRFLAIPGKESHAAFQQTF